MKGELNGVATQFLEENPMAHYTHCFGQSSNLAVQEMVKSNKILTDSLDYPKEIVKLIKRSPKRTAALEQIKTKSDYHAGVGILILCPTR